MTFLKCATPGCRHQNDLVCCHVCEALVCPKHAVRSAGEILCPACAPRKPSVGSRQLAAIAAGPQRELFA